MISKELEKSFFAKFKRLPLRMKLVVYAKIKHGNQFRTQNNDMLGLNRRNINKMYATFLNSIRNDINVTETP